MEPITHFLTGAVLGRSGFNRKTALATATMTLAAEAPDLDIFWRFKGPVYYFAHHRGFTHSFVGLLFMSALTVAVVYSVWILRGRRTNIPDLKPRWGQLFLLAYLAGLSHILLDFTNNYGVRPFWPFWGKSYSWDIVFIVEPALYIFLIGGLVVPLIFSRREARGHAAIGALLCVVILYGVRDYEHRAAVKVVRASTFENNSVSQKPQRASVYPYPWSITHWYAVAEMPGFFASTDVDSRTGILNRDLLEFYPQPPETPVTRVAKQSYLGRVFLNWAQYPLVTEAASGQNTSVHFRDLRFELPQRRGGVALLSGWVEVGPDLQIIGEGFGSRKQNPPLK
ncbi:MAG TPA: metal-dependent hydrolase [Terriglobales bacterium]|nr:metal-dependent hydrolase [Terriglobales bacterium]